MGAASSVGGPVNPDQGCPANLLQKGSTDGIDDEKVIAYSQSEEVMKIVKSLIQLPFRFEIKVNTSVCNIASDSWELILNGGASRYMEVVQNSSKDTTCLSWFVRK